jgi:hypothetical protein
MSLTDGLTVLKQLELEYWLIGVYALVDMRVNDIAIWISLLCRSTVNDIAIWISLLCRSTVNDIAIWISLLCRSTVKITGLYDLQLCPAPLGIGIPVPWYSKDPSYKHRLLEKPLIAIFVLEDHACTVLHILFCLSCRAYVAAGTCNYVLPIQSPCSLKLMCYWEKNRKCPRKMFP